MDINRLLDLTDPDKLARVSVQELQLGLSQTTSPNYQRGKASNRNYRNHGSSNNKPSLKKSFRNEGAFKGSRLYTLPEEQPGSEVKPKRSISSLSKFADSVDSNADSVYSESSYKRKFHNRIQYNSSQNSSPGSVRSTSSKRSAHSEAYEQTHRRQEEQRAEKSDYARKAEARFCTKPAGRKLGSVPYRGGNIQRTIDYSREPLYTPSSKSTKSRPDYRKAATDPRYAKQLTDKVIDSEKRRKHRLNRQHMQRQRIEEERERKRKIAQAQRARAAEMSKPSVSRRQHALEQRRKVEAREKRRKFDSPSRSAVDGGQSHRSSVGLNGSQDSMRSNHSQAFVQQQNRISKTDNETGLRRLNPGTDNGRRRLGHIPAWLMRRKEEMNKVNKTQTKSSQQKRIPFWERVNQQPQNKEQQRKKNEVKASHDVRQKSKTHIIKRPNNNLSQLKVKNSKTQKKANNPISKSSVGNKSASKVATSSKYDQTTPNKGSAVAASKPVRRKLPPRNTQKTSTDSAKMSTQTRNDVKTMKPKDEKKSNSPSSGRSRKFSSRMTTDEDEDEGYSDSFESFSDDDDQELLKSKSSTVGNQEHRRSGKNNSTRNNAPLGKAPSGHESSENGTHGDQAKVEEGTDEDEQGFFLTSFVASNYAADEGKTQAIKQNLGTPATSSTLPPVASTSKQSIRSQGQEPSKEDSQHKLPSLPSMASEKSQQSNDSDWF